MIRLDDQVGIITGSGRGLGAAYARLLAERGTRVVIYDAGVNKDGTGFEPIMAADAASRIREAGGVAFASNIILDSASFVTFLREKRWLYPVFQTQ